MNVRKILNNNNKGVTLIALIASMLVLVILAGIGLAIATGKNGVVERTTTARKKYNVEQQREDIAMAWAAVETEYSEAWSDDDEDNSFYTKDNLNKYLNGKGKITGDIVYENGKYIINYAPDGSITSGEFEVDSEGNVKSLLTDLNPVSEISIGKEVQYKNGERFYIIGQGTDNVILISKYNLNTEGNAQQSNTYYKDTACAFSSSEYWSDDWSSSSQSDSMNLNSYAMPSTENDSNNAIKKAQK